MLIDLSKKNHTLVAAIGITQFAYLLTCIYWIGSGYGIETEIGKVCVINPIIGVAVLLSVGANLKKITLLLIAQIFVQFSIFFALRDIFENDKYFKGAEVFMIPHAFVFAYLVTFLIVCFIKVKPTTIE